MKDENEKDSAVSSDQDQQHQPQASPQVVDRRKFLKTSAGAAVLGASVLAGAGKVNAQDAGKPGKFSTPDWKTLKPGKKDTDLYTEESGFDEDNPDMTWWSGRNIGGVTIGLVQIRANLPMMPGNMGNATTFDFPMLYREMNVDNVMDLMKPEMTKNFTDGIVEAAKWLELQGVSAIMGNCGFFGHYQKAVQERIDTPFFSSSLMMMPMIVQSLPRNKKVGVLTANGPLLASGQAMENCGLSRELQASRVVVEGCENDPEFAYAMSAEGKFNASRFERDILEGIKRLLKKDKDIAMILLECTELPPHAVAVQKMVKMPVWDYTSLTNWIYSGCVRRPFVGHI
jgi:aspartate/glutamate racemase